MNYDALITSIAEVHQLAQTGAARAVNHHHVLRNWLIGAWLVQFEQNGEDRAKYGTGLLKRVAADLRTKSITGCSQQMLERMRLFFRDYPQVGALISSSLMGILHSRLKSNDLDISSSVMRKLDAPPASGPPALPAQMLLRLSWTHLIEMLGLADPWQRAFHKKLFAPKARPCKKFQGDKPKTPLLTDSNLFASATP